MGSESDWPTMEKAAMILKDLDVPFESRVLSAHRTPDAMTDYAKSAADRGIKVIIAGAGGAAHLPGMIAANTVLPVIGVPVETKALKGMDSLLWALIEAELGTINEATKTHFEELRFEVSRLLRKLVEDLPEPTLDDDE